MLKFHHVLFCGQETCFASERQILCAALWTHSLLDCFKGEAWPLTSLSTTASYGCRTSHKLLLQMAWRWCFVWLISSADTYTVNTTTPYLLLWWIIHSSGLGRTFYMFCISTASTAALHWLSSILLQLISSSLSCTWTSNKLATLIEINVHKEVTGM